MSLQKSGTKHVFLADDDDDDRMLFRDALKEIQSFVTLTIAKDGEHLMKLLHELAHLPDLLFLDLNMPLKNGLECLIEIKKEKKFASLPVIIFSTSSQPSAIDEVYKGGAHLYVRKPNDYLSLKKTIQYLISFNWHNNLEQPSKENFVLDVG